jgi:hypothetical protein
MGTFRTLLLAIVFCAFRAPGQEVHVLEKALDDYKAGRNARAAVGFHQVAETGGSRDNGFEAEYFLAQSLARLGQGFSAFYHYGQIIEAGPGHPYYLEAIEGAVDETLKSRDEVLGPNVLSKAYNPEFRRLPPQVLAKVDYLIALLRFRAGKYEEAEGLLREAPSAGNASPQARYLEGLLQQRKAPLEAVQTLRSILALDGRPDLADLKELTHLALGRSLYGLQRFAEASREYGQLPRFSRHWDEALFEGAYADLMNDDPGGALGKLHGLHSPHLSDEFAPESLNLRAVIYHQRCLYPQVREVIADFNREYVPMKDQLRNIIHSTSATDAYWQMLQPGDARLPSAAQHHLQKNERVSAMVGYIARLDVEAAQVKASEVLSQSPLGPDLLDLIGKQKALMSQVAGKFIQGRLADMARLIEVLDGDKEILAFETAKGEKEILEGNLDVKERLAAQPLGRPPMPESGHEYWPFDGEYWPDEIGYYRYTIKDACGALKKAQ